MYPSLYSRAHSFILSPGLANKPKWSVIKEKIALVQLVVDERTLVIGKWYARGHRASFDPFDRLRASKLRTGRAWSIGKIILTRVVVFRIAFYWFQVSIVY